MSDLTCPSCGARLLTAAGHAGGEAGCPTCGAVIVVPGTPPEAAADRAAAAGTEATWDASPAEGGEVPPPRASAAGVDSQLPLALAAGSLLLPVLGPLAWWMVQRASEPIRARGEEEPDTIRHARFMAMTGTALLGLALLCCTPMLLVIG